MLELKHVSLLFYNILKGNFKKGISCGRSLLCLGGELTYSYRPMSIKSNYVHWIRVNSKKYLEYVFARKQEYV